MTPGKLLLFPTPLGESVLETIPLYAIDILHRTTVFLVEKAKTARHFIRDTRHPVALQELIIKEVEQAYPASDFSFLQEHINAGRDVGLMSEAGCPAIADPGAAIVLLAHQAGIEVVPLVGPSSILLALMASGMSGQQFCFHGYIAAKRSKLDRDLRRLEQLSRQNKQTQVFIEAPYRNNAVIEQSLESLSPTTLLGIATDITLPTQFISTRTVEMWRKNPPPDLHKRPTIFLVFCP